MSFEIKILGTNSATPVANRNQSSQLLIIENEYFLIDCGEACQHQLIKYRIKYNKISYIFISHLHGDHYLGLMGLISTMNLNGRTKDLYLFGPPGLDEIITVQLKYSETVLQFKVHFRVHQQAPEQILDLPFLTVETLPLKHRISCWGFKLTEKPKQRRINKEALPPDTSIAEIVLLKNGHDLKDEKGNVRLKHEEVTLPPKKNRSYAYCSDTEYNEELIPLITGTDLLYHESTFTLEKKDRAKETHHSTAFDAATIAKKSKVGQLIIGHFSSRYKDTEPLLLEAKSVFVNTLLAEEGLSYFIPD